MMPHKTFPAIGTATEAPTWQQVQKAYTLAAENAAAIPSEEGNGQLGHVEVVVGGPRYLELSNGIPFVPPPPAGDAPNYPANRSHDQHNESIRDYDKHSNKDWTYKTVRKIVTYQILDSVHTNYKSEFYTAELGYRCTFQELEAHLRREFGTKTNKELEANTSAMAKPWDATVPIQALFVRIEDGMRFDPSIPQSKIIREVIDLICINEGFDSAFDAWQVKPETEKTWINLKIHFAAADKRRRNKLALKASTTTTPPATYPGSANSVTTTSTDRLAKGIEKLLVILEATPGGATTITTAATAAATDAAAATPRPPRTRRTNPAGGREPTAAEVPTLSYCWSHGYCLKREGKPDHTSATCNRKRDGHKTEATATNKMGGEARICNSWNPNFQMPSPAE